MPKYPVAPRRQIIRSFHGHRLSDPYRWMQDPDDPEVKAYLLEESDHTSQCMSSTLSLQEELYREMIGRLPGGDTSVPVVHGVYLYYTRQEADQPYLIHCRRRQDDIGIEAI